MSAATYAALTIPDPSSKVGLLLQIAQLKPCIENIFILKEIVETIKDKYLRNCRFVDIANVESLFDIEAAKSTLKKIYLADSLLNKTSFKKNSLLQKISLAQTTLDLESAQFTADLIKDPDIKANAYIKIAIALAIKDLCLARKFVKDSDISPDKKIEAYIEIAKIEMVTFNTIFSK